MREFTIALDLDGVIWDLVTPWVEAYNKKFDDSLYVEDIKDYDLTKFMKKATRAEFCQLLDSDEFWETVKPFPETAEYLEKLNNRVNLVIATKSHYKSFRKKVEKLLDLFPFLDYKQIICISDKSLLNVDMLVDDCADNLISEDAKFIPVIYDAPYNRTYEFDGHLLRVYSLKDVYEKWCSECV